MLTLENTPLILQTRPAFEMTDEQFFEFCQINCNYRIERNAKGELLVMSPVGSETGHYNAKLTQQLGNWCDEDGTGIDFDSSAGFTLPNGAARSPDAAWVKLENWQTIPLEQRRKFAPLCPDFVVELRSPSDNLKPLQEKMEEYIENGASLGWLIDRQNRRVYVYRPQVAVECLESPTMVKGDPLLSGFVLKLEKIW
ncbi:MULTISPECIES: Uma2 family endonuclease [Spirulina sp. CCY15215]|uniref:Uma2 family endonuclease n=1 Tax=Spirulina sp. CCY15215 TaxID=2767591 RepID=UPI00194FA723|nr:Uma2 family endonuclease [Spirulina major]